VGGGRGEDGEEKVRAINELSPSVRDIQQHRNIEK